MSQYETAFSDEILANAFADTEAEIFDEAVNGAPSEESDDGDRTPEMVEGLDGEPLTNEQQLEAHMNNREPGQYWLEKGAQQYEDEFQKMVAERDALKAHVEQLHQTYDPFKREMAEQNRAQAHQNLIDRAIND